MVKWSELAVAKASLARLASSFLFIGVENGDFSDMAAAMVACRSKKKKKKKSTLRSYLPHVQVIQRIDCFTQLARRTYISDKKRKGFNK